MQHLVVVHQQQVAGGDVDVEAQLGRLDELVDQVEQLQVGRVEPACSLEPLCRVDGGPPVL